MQDAKYEDDVVCFSPNGGVISFRATMEDMLRVIGTGLVNHFGVDIEAGVGKILQMFVENGCEATLRAADIENTDALAQTIPQKETIPMDKYPRN